VIYKITYPNGKIYIGQDRTDDVNYFGSADSFTVAQDFSAEELMDFTIRKEILERRENISIRQLNLLERLHIIKCGSAYPDIGYNRTHQKARQHCRTLWSDTA
jgi:hypothetical protein